MNEYPIGTYSVRADTHMYSRSKLCNILFTTELAVKLSDTGVTVNTLHPGVIKTEIYRRLPRAFVVILDAIANLYFKVKHFNLSCESYKYLTKIYAV